MKTVPISAFQETNGMIYFARMVDKIRKHARGELREDFTDNLGKGFDARCVNFLRVSYDALTKRVLEGGADTEILQWCFANGRELSEGDIFIYNAFMRKAGIADGVTELVARRKKESGLEHRNDIQTMLEYFEVDEGRKA
ncbi:MAG: DUF5069 domain-containing protein [Verrucomicrobiota bacterium]|nr:DUF5069 domain-containing protein [Verrucomicrobiota bacterium]